MAVCLLLVGLITMFACHKNVDSGNSSNSNTVQPDQLVTASLQGRVLDENGLPVMGAAVTSGSASTTTDVNGIFRFSNIKIYSRFGFVQVTKQGYFTGSRTIVTNPGVVNFVHIDLLPRVSKGSFSATSGGAITVQTGNTVNFDGGSIVNGASGAAYSGNVNVYAAYLDPTDATVSGHMPGSLRGITTNNSEVGLKSFGMMAVELEGDAGEKLQIASGKKATLTMAIPASLQASAPATIPLWYFNDSTGKWIEEGTATRQGNNYIGQVGHFTWWNCDMGSVIIPFKARFADQQGNPLAYTHVSVYDDIVGYSFADLYTDSTGLIQYYAVQGETYTLKVMDDCGNMIGGANMGPVLTTQDLGTISITLSNGVLTLTGTVVDCNSSPVANGYVNVLVDGLDYRAAVTNGSFIINILRCNGLTVEAQVVAGDYGSGQQGAMTKINVHAGSQDAGQLSACGGNIDQYITVTIRGNTYTVTSTKDSLFLQVSSYQAGQANYNFWGVYQATSPDYVSFYFAFAQLTSVGEYSTNYYLFHVGGMDYAPREPLQCQITEVGPANGYLSGTLSSLGVADSVSEVGHEHSYPLTGSFRLKRTIVN